MALRTVTISDRDASGQAVRVTPAHRVYLKSSWSAPWELTPYLYCDWCEFCLNPRIPKAQFSWRYGLILQVDRELKATFSRLDRLRYYVKVEIDNPDDAETPIVWVGILEEDNGEQKGFLNGGAGEVPRGRQELVAYGLEIMLERTVVTTSVVAVGSGTYTLERALEFNERVQQHHGVRKEPTGNRTQVTGPGAVFTFESDPTSAEFWSSVDIVDYLLKYHAPKNELDLEVIRWQLNGGAFFGFVPSWDKPRIAAQNRTLRQTIDQVLHRSRLLGYFCRIVTVGATERVEIYPVTFAPANIAFGGQVIPENDSQVTLLFDDAACVNSAIVRKASLDGVDAVVCYGGRIVSCFTLFGAAQLEAGWTAAQETAYEAAASGTAGYGSLDLEEQQALNEVARNAESLENVYSRFDLLADWDGITYGSDFYFPFNEVVPGAAALAWYRPGLKFEHVLPLKTFHDYAAVAADGSGVVESTPAGLKWEYRRPLVGLAVSDGESTTMQIIDKSIRVPDVAGDWDLQAAARMAQDGPAIQVTLSGVPQHALADGTFTPLAADDGFTPLFDWRADLWCTVAMRVDRYAIGYWPPGPPATDALRIQTIDLGDDYLVHYLCEGTILDIDAAGQEIQAPTSAYLRDDRPKLEELARLAYEWYSRPRQSIELKLAIITAQVRVGELVRTIGSGAAVQTINSVITSIRYELPETEGHQATGPKTTITTEFAELDIRDLAARPDTSS